jgi:hypothetical protein
MRIGMMVDMYKPHISGVTHYVSLNKRALEAAGHEVEVFTFGGRVVEDGPGVHRSGHARGRIRVLPGISHHGAARLQQMELVHVHHPF